LGPSCCFEFSINLINLLDFDHMSSIFTNIFLYLCNSKQRRQSEGSIVGLYCIQRNEYFVSVNPIETLQHTETDMDSEGS